MSLLVSVLAATQLGIPLGPGPGDRGMSPRIASPSPFCQYDVAGRAWLRRRGRAQWDAGAGVVSRRGAFGIGVLHGTGAETPTQVVLLATAATAGSAAGSGFVLLGFALVLLTSDLGVAALWLSGRLGAVRMPGGAIALGVLTGVTSVAVGVAFILQRSAMLPRLVGG